MHLRYSPLALMSLVPLVSAVSLVDFTPRMTNLPAACEKVYTTQIAGCQGSDFSGSGCSQACINGLEAMVDPVKSACGNKGLTGEYIIVAFLANMGPQQLCKNAPSAGASSSSPSSTAPASSTGAAASSSQTDASSSVVSSAVSSTTPASSSSVLVSSITSSAMPSSTSGALIVDTSSTPSGTMNPAATPSTKSGGSGGGSPFDTQTTTSFAPALSASFAMLTVGLTTTVFLLGGLRI